VQCIFQIADQTCIVFSLPDASGDAAESEIMPVWQQNNAITIGSVWRMANLTDRRTSIEELLRRENNEASNRVKVV
jgi:hypothetical protein